MRKMSGARKSVALLAAVSFAATLAACSSGDNAKDNGTTPAASDKGTTASGPVEIEYMHRLPDGEGMTKVNDIVAKWNAEHPDIQVKATKFDGKSAEMITKLETDINAGVGPCLAQLGYAEVPEMYVKGLTEDVTKYAQQYEKNYSGAFGMMKVGETIVGLPQDTGPLVYFYNKAAFDQLGIKVPTTLAEFKDAAAKAAASGKYIAAFEPDEAQYFLSAQAAAAGGTWFSVKDDKWVVNVDSDASKTVAEFWQGLLDNKQALVLNRCADEYPAALNNQSLIGNIGPAWDTPLLADAMKGTANEGQWAVAQIPDFGAGALTGPDGGSGVAVMKGCKYPEQAMEFNNWFNTQVDDLVSQGLVVAATTGTMTTPDAVKAFYGGQDVSAELSKANKNLSANFAYMPFFSALGSPMGEAAAAAGSGSGKVADVFSSAQKAAVDALTNGGLPVAK